MTQEIQEPGPLSVRADVCMQTHTHTHTHKPLVPVCGVQTACIAGGGSFVVFQTLLRATETATG